ncbi:ABC transporter substrate binding protein [uncultured Sanguibacteroides sp.]|uniref:ABC transporter substrate binding protein n=1 Tax=uncultured Sanguibacteroides sp. TaxID=1635151 RepID=UPI0025EA4735|nr:ABC transporter substrate binding protein [uncultured Sanguibacteroides sp.]
MKKIAYLGKEWGILLVWMMIGIVSVKAETGVFPMADSVKQVLFISSYHEEQIWTRNIIRAVKRQLKDAGLKVDLRIIHLDSKRTKDKDKQGEILHRTLSEIRGRQDLIIVSDKEANQIFFSLDIPMIKKIPVVFCAVAVSDYRKQEGWENVTGVVSILDYEKIFLVGLRLFPEAHKVYVISDSTEPGRMHKMLAQKQLSKYEADISIEYVGEHEATVDDLIKRMEDFDPLSFIILSTWQRDQRGMYRSAEIYYPVFSKEAPAPILSSLDFAMGNGILGGYLLRAEDQGTRTGKLAVRVLKGEDVRTIPVDTARGVFMFDDVQLKRRRVERESLPSGSIIMNEPESVFVTYRNYIFSFLVFLVLLVTLLVLFLFFYLRYRKMFHRSQKLEAAAKGMAKNLERKTEVLSHTLSSMEEGIVVVNREMEVLEMNCIACKNLGCRQDEIGKRLNEVCTICADGDEKYMQRVIRKVMEKGERQVLNTDALLIPTQGEVKHVTGSISPLFDSLHGVVGAVLIFRDMTDELQQQRFLKISIGVLRFYTWVFNIDKQVFEYGEGFGETGAQKEPFDTLEKFVLYVHPEDRAGFSEFFERVQKQDSGEFTAAYRVDYKGNGQYSWWECRGVVQTIDLGRDKKIKYLYGLDINIEQHKRIEEELKHAMKKAEESDRLKSAFLANISHEIRTPLNGIVGFANLICEKDYSDEEKQTFCAAINKNSKLLLSLLDDILNLSRIESNSVGCQVEECDVNEMVNSVFETHRFMMPEQIVLLKGETPVGLRVKTDRVKLTQVFANLINNAKKFTLQGKITLGARISEDREWLEFSVADTGEGIPEESLPYIFDRFYRVNEFKPGTGLGLSICKAIMNLLGGDIRVESEWGKGTTFYFRIPVYSDKEKGHFVFGISNEPEELSVVVNDDKKHILIAEDTDSNYLLLKALLKKDYMLDRARDGIEAVEMFKKNKYDAILMDLKMPRMDGLEAMIEIRKFSEIPIIVQTAYAFDVDREKCWEAGCTDFISKPIKSVTIHSILKKHLS